MERPRIVISENEEEFEVTAAVTSIGRTHENELSFPEDSNVSRYHIEIEERDGEFWIVDLQSSNGTTVNGDSLTEELPLSHEDVIVLGGSTELIFITEKDDDSEKKDEKDSDDEEIDEGDGADAGAAEAVVEDEPGSRKFTYLLIFAAIAIGLAVVLVIAALIFLFSGGTISSSDGGGGGGLFSSSCEATATIVSPENGDIISEVANVEVRVKKSACVKEAIFSVGGKEFSRAQGAPFTAKLIPSKYPTMSDGRDRMISVTLIDRDGNSLSSRPQIAISLETIETEDPEPTPVIASGDPGPGNPDARPAGPGNTSKPASLIDTQQLTKKVIPQFSGNRKYNTNNQRFLEAVSKMTAEYVSAGYYQRAAKYRDHINNQFLREQNLDPQLGYILAMSRTKFEPQNKAEGAGLWKMNNQLVLDNNYNGICGQETIASESQKCAAIASSTYLKDLILNVFNGDLVYGVAAFGMDKQQASQWNASLPNSPQARADFWNVIKDPGRREQVVRFFAAAIVMENPKKFGLDRDRPISGLFPAYID